MEISSGAEESAIAIQETAEAIEDVRLFAVEVSDRAEDSSERSKEMLEELVTDDRSISCTCRWHP